MGQKVNPISNRLGIICGWDSNWYGGRKYGERLLEDSKLRKYLNARLAKASVSRIVIERTLKLITITVCTARPGLIIGKGGQEVDKLKEELKKITDKDVQINIFEVKRPEVDATIVASNIARQIEGKNGYRIDNACRCRRYQGAGVGSTQWCRDGSFGDVQRGSYPVAYTPCRHRLCIGGSSHQSGSYRYQGLDLPR